MIKIYQKTIREKEFKSIETFKVGSWIYVENPTSEELDQLVTDHQVERELLEDALDPYEVPRSEIAGGQTYIYTRIPYRDGGRISTHPLLLIVGTDFLMTVSKRQVSFLDKIINKKAGDYNTTQKVKMLIKFFGELNTAYNTFLIQISRSVRNYSIEVEKIKNKDIAQFVSFENILNDFLSALVPTNTILNNLLSGRHLKLFDSDKDLIEDLFIDNNQLIELCRSNLKSIVNIREAYSTIMTHNLNQVIKLFTTVTVVMTIPMVVASLYGMNVMLPMADNPNAFWWILLATMAVAVVALAVFVHKRWL